MSQRRRDRSRRGPLTASARRGRATLARRAGFDAEAAAERGAPAWQRIVEAADERDVGIVVLGSHGRTGMAWVLIGSVAGAVASHSRRPVLIAHLNPER